MTYSAQVVEKKFDDTATELQDYAHLGVYARLGLRIGGFVLKKKSSNSSGSREI